MRLSFERTLSKYEKTGETTASETHTTPSCAWRCPCYRLAPIPVHFVLPLAVVLGDTLGDQALAAREWRVDRAAARHVL